MTESADVVVVGSGIIGASIAYQLAVRGVGVVALDKAAGPAEGSTGASTSICRCKYTLADLTNLASFGLDVFANWSDFTRLEEVRAELHRVGVVWMTGASRMSADEDAARLAEEGVQACVLGPDDLTSLFPAMSNCDAPFDLTGEIEHECRPGEAFLYEPESGYVDPVGANQDLIEATRRSGGEVRFRSEVVGFTRTGTTVTGVELSDGTTISADLVINAGGPWCNGLNRLAGLEMDWTLTPTRIQTVYRPWPENLGTLPIGIDTSTGVAFRPESAGQQVIVGSVLPEDEEEIVSDPDDFKQVPDADFTQMKLALFHHRVPSLEPRGQLSGIAGLYTINREDVHPVVGATGIDGYWVAIGFSGHGFKLAPAIGSMTAQAITGEKADFDTDVSMSLFAVDREPLEIAVKHVLA